MRTSSYIILIDALRYDYVTEKDSPFLYALSKKAKVASVIETFAFQTRPAFFAGLEPDQSGVSHLLEYNPAQSPFSFLKPLNPLLKLIDPWGYCRLGRGLIKRLARLNATKLSQPAARDVLSTEETPLHILSELALSERDYTDTPNVYGKLPSIFDDFRSNNLSWNWIGYPKHFGSTQSILAQFINTPKADVNYLHFSELDWIGHKFGPNSNERRSALSKLDNDLKELLETPIKEGSKVFIFGDHGMVEVTYAIDLISQLKKSELNFGKDYLTFLDSTQARFWFKSDAAEKKIIANVQGINGGHWLSYEERKELHITDKKFGDAVFAVDGTGILHPSFFSHATNPPKGMHGYLPKIRDNMSYLIAYPSNYQDMGTIKMTEIYSLMKEFILDKFS